MANRRDKERQEETVSARRWTDSQQGGASYLSIPNGTKMFKAEGDKVYKLDVMAYRVGKGNPMADAGLLHFERTYFVHYNVGVNKKAYCCLKQFNKACPVCLEWERKKVNCKDKDEDKKLYQMYSPKKRQLWNVIDTENRDAGIQLWDVSFHLFGKALVEKVKKADEEERDAINAFADPRKGMMLRISTTKENAQGNNYVDCSDIEFKPRKEQYEKSIVDEAICLDALIREETFDVIEASLVGEVEPDEDDDDKPKNKKKPGKKPVDDDEDDDEDEKPKSKKSAKKDDDEDDDDVDDDEKASSKKPGKKPIKDDDEDEDEDDEPKAKKPTKKPVKDDDDEDDDGDDDEEDEDGDGEDDDEEETPKSKKRGKSSAKDNDDDDDDEDGDDDEEDEKPKTKKPAKKPVEDDDDEGDDEDEKPKSKKPAKATAESLGIKLGTEVTYEKTKCTVVKITDDGATLTLEDEDEEIHRKIPVGEVEIAKAKKPKK